MFQTQAWRSAVLAALATLLLAGCPVTGTFIEEPAGGGQDSGGQDGSTADSGGTDSGQSDSGLTDAGDNDAGPTDGGPTDGGPTDAGPTDAGPTDGGPTDAGPTDGGPTDAGPTDAGPTDAGPIPDGGPWQPTQCPYTATRTGLSLGTDWERVGPPGGNVTAVLAMGNGVVLAGTSQAWAGPSFLTSQAGIYHSTDSGNTFTQVRAFGGLSVSALARVGTTSRVYAAVSVNGEGTAETGVWVSDDGNAPFTQVTGGMFANPRAVQVAVAPGTPERVWALVAGTSADPTAAAFTLYRRDGGTGDWVELTNAMANVSAVDAVSLALAADPANPDRVYLAGGRSWYVSDDAGDNFSAGTTYLASGSIGLAVAMAVDPGNPSHLTVGTRSDGLWESTNAGTDWSQALTGVGVGQIAFSGATTFAATSGNGLMSASGAAWARNGACLNDTTVLSVSTDPATSLVVVGAPGGVWRSTDNAATFARMTSGIDELTGRVTVAADAVWLMSSGGLFRSTNNTNNSVTWEQVAEDAGTLCVASVAADPSDANNVLISTSPGFCAAGGSPGVIKMTLPGKTLATATGFAGPSIPAATFDPSTSGRAFAYQCGSIDDGIATAVFSSADSGGSFSSSSTSLPACGFDDVPLAVAADDGTVFAGALSSEVGTPTAQLYRSTDGGANFDMVWEATDTTDVNCGGGTGANLLTWVGLGVHVDPSGANTYLTGWNACVGLMRSTNAHTDASPWTFQPVGTTMFGGTGDGLVNFTSMVNGLAFGSGSALTVATQGGVLHADDGETFTDLSSGLPSPTPPVKSLARTTGGTAVLFATTPDGVWRRTAP